MTHVHSTGRNPRRCRSPGQRLTLPLRRRRSRKADPAASVRRLRQIVHGSPPRVQVLAAPRAVGETAGGARFGPPSAAPAGEPPVFNPGAGLRSRPW